MPGLTADFSDMRGVQDSGPVDLGPTQGLGLTADFSDIRSGGLAFGKTGQQKAQDIARTAGFDVSPEFGSGVVERGIADFGKGLAGSLPGRLIGAATGNSQTIEALGQLPASQPIPYFPDLDTIGQLSGDAAMFSLVPAAALPGRLIGRGIASKMPILANILSKGSRAHVELTQEIASEIAGANMHLFEAAGGAASAAAGFGGLTKLAGGDNTEAALNGVMAGTAAAFRPAFAAFKATAHSLKLTGKAYQAAEGAFADAMDTGMSPFLAAQHIAESVDKYAGGNRSRELARRMQSSLAEELETGLGKTIDKWSDYFAERGGFKGNIPEARRMVEGWEDAVSKTMLGPAQRLFESKGWGAAAKAYTKLATSVDQSLRRSGPSGVRIANGIKRGLATSERETGELNALLQKNLKGVSDEALDSWAVNREAGLAPAGTKDSVGLDGVSYLLDHVVPNQKLGSVGVKLEGFEAGHYLPRIVDHEAFEKWLRDVKNVPKFATAKGITEDQAITEMDKMRTTLAEFRGQPATTVLRSAIDLPRQLGLTTEQMRQLGIPVSNTRAALTRYMRQVGDRVGLAEQFGPKSERLTELMKDLEQQHSSSVYGDVLRDSVRKSIGLDAEVGDLAKMFSFWQQNVMVPTKLALAPISNAGQSVNTMAKVGGRVYARGVAELRREARAFKGKGGTPSEFYSTLNGLMDEMGAGLGDIFSSPSESSKFLLDKVPGVRESIPSRLNIGAWFLNKNGFNSIEKFNRMAAAYSGKSWLEGMVTKAVRGTLSPKLMQRAAGEFKQLGLDFEDIVARGAMTQKEALDGAIGISNLTQFRIRPSELPLWWSSPNAAAFRMLKTFGFQQARFIKNQIAGPAAEYVSSGGRRGNIRPLAFLAAGYPSAGYAIGSARSLLKGQVPFEGQGPLSTYASSLAWIGGFGLLQDLARSADSGSQALLQLGAGPLFADGAEFLSALVDGAQKGSTKRVARTVMKKTLPFYSQNVGGIGDQLDDALGLKDN